MPRDPVTHKVIDTFDECERLTAENDALRAQLAAATARVVVFEAALDSPELLEQLAALEHDERWSGWERYRVEKSGRMHPGGELYEERWKRLRETSYSALSERDKESDRIEVRKSLALIRAFLADPDPLVAAVARLATSARRMKTVWSHFGVTVDGEQIISEAERTFRTDVDAFRALAPWWPS